ncbi:unnamed protein product [Ostreobium quekettii]|uniref:Uncharacterized protein n=1 Tax=Ostreobium quekettii TaxID=121088 RepID=A0A8S1IYD6_9CHLO|nr:unnamed protein product [Ostreobium quekettii]
MGVALSRKGVSIGGMGLRMHQWVCSCTKMSLWLSATVAASMDVLCGRSLELLIGIGLEGRGSVLTMWQMRVGMGLLDQLPRVWWTCTVVAVMFAQFAVYAW